jgi:hypothetical protein
VAGRQHGALLITLAHVLEKKIATELFLALAFLALICVAVPQ